MSRPEFSLQLTWQPMAGASTYAVYRGTSATSITTMVTALRIVVTATSCTDTTATNGTTYCCAVQLPSTNEAQSSKAFLVVQAKFVERACVATEPTCRRVGIPATPDDE